MNKKIRGIIITNRIWSNLDRYPVLYERFYMNKLYCYEEILKSAYDILEIIKTDYPKGHLFLRDEFIFDEMLFSIAYCNFIGKKYLGNVEIMNDFINKKLKSMYKGVFSIKVFNENLSEFMIYFYMLTSIFFKSDLYKDFKTIKYETIGANNKRFEYTFIIGNKEINIEVKALDCDPFSKDNLDVRELKDGDIFIKSYFNRPIEEYNIIKLNKVKILSSNYRQLKKNIKRIDEKCKKTDLNTINLGFVIINYGTSREEFLSYLFNSKYGIMNLYDVKNVDGIMLFSMCTDTTLLFDEVYLNDHILTALLNDNIENFKLFEALRLDKYIYNNGCVIDDITSIVEEEYQLYRYILKGGLMTIESYYIDENIIEEKINTLNEEVFDKKRDVMRLIRNTDWD
ncbi:hypothetical protein JCM1393_15390 [Clostridium carnis]